MLKLLALAILLILLKLRIVSWGTTVDPNDPTKRMPIDLKKLPWKKFVVFFIAFKLTFLIIAFSTSAFYLNRYINAFESKSGASRHEVYSLILRGIERTPTLTNGRKNILILGTDELSNRAGDPVFTDTIMLLSLHVESGELSTVSLPRDLWSPEYQTKINSLYFYGQERYPERPEQFTQEVIEQIAEVEIHHTIVLTLDQVADIIDILGGIEVEIAQGFVDEQFPRSDVDIRTETDPSILYETVRFDSGLEVMSGERALKYIRSRKSSDLTAGTDDARSQRQQQVIASLIKKISTPSILRHPERVGRLYEYYSSNFSQSLPMEELISIANMLRMDIQNIRFSSNTLSIETEEQSGVISHPPINKYNQWVYEISDQEAFITEVHSKLNL